jgi:mycoredoxin
MVRGILNQAKISHDYVNIHKDAQAAEIVRGINRGYESVPTLIFPDGSTLTEPSNLELKEKLASLGLEIENGSWLAENLRSVILGAVVLILLVWTVIQ